MTVTPLRHRLFHLNHYICPADVSLIEFLDLAVGYGFRGVGLTVRALQEISPRMLKKELAARNLGISSVNSAGYFLNDIPELARKQAEQNVWLIECVAELEDGALNVIPGGLGQARGKLTLEQARLRANEDLAALHVQAQRAGVALMVEPVHPLSIWTKSCVNTLQETVAGIRGLSGAGVTLDLFHSWWDPDLMSFIERSESAFGVLQICDVGNFLDDGLPRRIPLGEGVLDVPALLMASLRRSRPPKIEVELFAHLLPPNPLTVWLDKSVTYLNKLDTAHPV
ncbi:MAG: sugar phosphate isomerase/epimerase family protein [Pseudomonadota bacterium]